MTTPRFSFELIEALDAIPGDDGERMHSDADALLLAWLEASHLGELRDVAEAYRRAQDRASFWATA